MLSILLFALGFFAFFVLVWGGFCLVLYGPLASRRVQRIGKPADYSSWDRGERSTSVGFAKPVRRRRRFISQGRKG